MKSLQETLRPSSHKLAKAGECASTVLQGWPSCTTIVNIHTAHFADFLVKWWWPETSCEFVPGRSKCGWNWRWSCSVKPQPPGSSAAQIVLKYWFCSSQRCRTAGTRRQAHLQNTKPLGREREKRERWEEKRVKEVGKKEGWGKETEPSYGLMLPSSGDISPYIGCN